MIYNRVKLSDKEPLAKGKKRLIYRHPECQNHLIKVNRKFKPGNKNFLIRYLLTNKYIKFTYIKGFLREIREFVISRYEKTGHVKEIISNYIGLVDTDLGLGMVVQGFCDENGSLAPTLKSLIKKKCIESRHILLYKEFCKKVLSSNIVIGDLNTSNIVLAEISNKEQFVIVDGLGDKTFLPVKRIIKSVNYSSKRKKLDEILVKIRNAEKKKVR